MDRLKHSLFQFPRGLFNHHQGLLASRRDHGRHNAPAVRKLLDPGLRHGFTARCGNDARIRRPLGVTSHAIAKQQVNVGNPQGPQIVARAVVQATQAFDAVHLAGQPTQHRCLVAAAGADLQHTPQLALAVLAAAHQQLAHAGHHVGFGNRLAQADRQAGVFVGLVHECTVHKAMPLDSAHGGQHLGIADTLRRQLLHHPRAHRAGVEPKSVRWCGLLTIPGCIPRGCCVRRYVFYSNWLAGLGVQPGWKAGAARHCGATVAGWASNAAVWPQ